ncbi:putative F420-dependent oxidoreductase, MSMEG_2256 family [Aeromicrobium marinum DSM 15272]|uniref:F420-dependent oxidoreductase, MSMEG_2256 family n=1 Tax=Aeromicrobium marinum DSM 15272 TaxID=585531 RepID=E2SEL4_9ACTN|nr:TIGR03617 family F420-dependent LLM class oxidoreductase [Aeromicrobium marinum]EFQ82311.1 putative F420-dependent oxidoreductase, MSMEG_2256 family [Aeromicrobium marinum DSM 15272]
MTDETPLAIDMAFHGSPALGGVTAREAEDRGVVGGLFVPEGHHDPFITLAMAAANTRTLEIGSGIALAFARTPMSMAYSAYDLHQLAGGRSILGLGSQIKAHITRRYDMPWSEPAKRMAEYVEALRAIWNCWQTGEALDFRGDFYSHTLMPPLFNPGPLGFDSPRVWIAAVGPLMVRTAGTVGDGIICHPLISRRYLAEVMVPQLTEARSGRPDHSFATTTMAMVATGHTEEALAAAIAGTRKQIGFYASTPAYRPVLDHHGWGDLHEEANTFSKTGRWAELADLIDDEVLNTFAVVGEVSAAGAALRERFAGLVDRVTLSMPYQPADGLALDLAAAASS